MLERLTPVPKVLELYRDVRVWREEELELPKAISKYVAKDYYAVEDNPPKNKAVMDGYAVNAEELYEMAELTVGKEAIPVNTGDEIPEWANAVVPIERVEVKGDKIIILKPVPPGYAIAKKGEDIKKGEVIIRKGQRIRPWHVGALASQGFWKVSVVSPKIAIASTGDELVEPWKSGGVRNSTAWLVKSYFEEDLGFEVDYKGIIGDDEEKIKKYFEESLEDYDIVMTTGGTSVGRRDFSAKALKSVADKWFHGVALTPGRPMAIGVKDGKLLIALSGYPVAALSELEAVVFPIIRKAMGLEDRVRAKVKAKLMRRISIAPGTVHVYRVRIWRCGEELCTEPLRLTGSGVLKSVLEADGLLVIGTKGETGADVGEYVEVELLRPLDL